jgi:biotin transport system substrate-specific component
MSSPTLAAVALARPAETRTRTLVRKAALVVGFSLFIALSAQIAVPIGPVPISGQTLAVLLTGAVLGWRLGALAVVAYLAEGLAGAPVFANGQNAWMATRFPGVPYILGTTGGYLFGFVLAAAVVGWLAERGWDRSIPRAVAAMVLGNVAVYLIALPWLARFPLPISVFDAGLFPFLPGDALKIAIAAVALPGAWALLGRRSKTDSE